MRSNTCSWAAGLALAFACTVPATAQTPVPNDIASEDSSARGTAFAQPVDAAALAGYRGGAQTVSNDMTLAGTTADNTAHHITTGTNTIGTGAFSSMSGIPVVIQNSGANVLIQNALIVHMQMN
jgi:hypothetical protein